MTTLPCCQFPTTVLLVDDNPDFLSALTLLINSPITFKQESSPRIDNLDFLSELRLTYTPIKRESNPINALSIIEKQHLRSNIFQKCFQSIESEELELNDTSSSPITLLNVSQLHHLKDNINRFAAVSLLLVDYSMPQMNGIELCEKLKSIPIKKAMITGEADLKIAVKAFNEGIINQFIKKNSDHFKQEVRKTIASLQEKYFLDISQPLLARLKHRENIWENPTFYNFIKQTQVKLRATEFYLLDLHGSYIFIDALGNSTIVAVKSAQEMEKDYHTAIDNDAPVEIHSKLKDKTHFVFFLTDKNLKLSAKNWGNIIHQAKLIPEMKETFYTIIKTDQCDLHYDIERISGINLYLKHTESYL